MLRLVTVLAREGEDAIGFVGIAVADEEDVGLGRLLFRLQAERTFAGCHGIGLGRVALAGAYVGITRRKQKENSGPEDS